MRVHLGFLEAREEARGIKSLREAVKEWKEAREGWKRGVKYALPGWVGSSQVRVGQGRSLRPRPHLDPLTPRACLEG